MVHVVLMHKNILRKAQRYSTRESILLLLISSEFLIYLFLQLVIDYLSILQVPAQTLFPRRSKEDKQQTPTTLKTRRPSSFDPEQEPRKGISQYLPSFKGVEKLQRHIKHEQAMDQHKQKFYSSFCKHWSIACSCLI